MSQYGVLVSDRIKVIFVAIESKSFLITGSFYVVYLRKLLHNITCEKFREDKTSQRRETSLVSL